MSIRRSFFVLIVSDDIFDIIIRMGVNDYALGLVGDAEARYFVKLGVVDGYL